MTKLVHLVATCLLGQMVHAAAANAQFQPQHSAATIFTEVEKLIANAPDQTKVRLRGNIIQRLEDELYIFRDYTGMVVIEISDNFEWPGEVNEETPIEIAGEVEREGGRVEVEVTQVQILDTLP